MQRPSKEFKTPATSSQPKECPLAPPRPAIARDSEVDPRRGDPVSPSRTSVISTQRCEEEYERRGLVPGVPLRLEDRLSIGSALSGVPETLSRDPHPEMPRHVTFDDTVQARSLVTTADSSIGVVGGDRVKPRVDDTLIHIMLIWNSHTDLDIHVKTPDGIDIFWRYPVGNNCYLLLDENARAPYKPEVEKDVPVEDFYLLKGCLDGVYRLGVHNFKQRGGDRTPFAVHIVEFHEGQRVQRGAIDLDPYDTGKLGIANGEYFAVANITKTSHEGVKFGVVMASYEPTLERSISAPKSEAEPESEEMRGRSSSLPSSPPSAARENPKQHKPLCFFISHTTSEVVLADAIKKKLDDAFPGARTWSMHDIPAGAGTAGEPTFNEHILEKIRECDALVGILSRDCIQSHPKWGAPAEWEMAYKANKKVMLLMKEGEVEDAKGLGWHACIVMPFRCLCASRSFLNIRKIRSLCSKIQGVKYSQHHHHETLGTLTNSLSLHFSKPDFRLDDGGGGLRQESERSQHVGCFALMWHG